MDPKQLVRLVIQHTVRLPVLGTALINIYERRAPQTGWNRQHPFDRLHGARTSGSLPGIMLGAGITAYAAAQPSIIRTALRVVPDPQTCHFLDLGCGKGRALLVATEFGFRAVTGVEYSSTLAQIAHCNAALFSRRNPSLPAMNIVTGDAITYELPPAPLVIFLYNPFEEKLMRQLLQRIETWLHADSRDLYIIYYNPVWASVLDASVALERRFAAQLPYDTTEVDYGPDRSDAVVIWQNRGNPHPRPAGLATATVHVVTPSWRAEVVA